MCRRILSISVLAFAASFLVTGCKTSSTTNPATLAPGAYNKADQTLYQSLMAAQASLNSLKASAASTPSLVPYVNQAIVDYDAAEVAYQTYHAALAANPSTSPTAAQAAVTKVQTDLQAAPTK